MEKQEAVSVDWEGHTALGNIFKDVLSGTVTLS